MTSEVAGKAAFSAIRAGTSSRVSSDGSGSAVPGVSAWLSAAAISARSRLRRFTMGGPQFYAKAAK